MELKLSRDYEAGHWNSWRLGGIFGVLGGSSQGLFGQAVALAHDRLRNHSVLATVFAYGSWDEISSRVFYTNSVSRLQWGAGLFHSIFYRLDHALEDEGLSFFSGERFFGANGIARYPFDRFRHVQVGLAAGGLSHFLPGDLPDLLTEEQKQTWDQDLPGLQARVQASASLGYNSLLYHRLTGPVRGTSALLRLTGAVQTPRTEGWLRTQFDAERYVLIHSPVNLLLRVGGGHLVGGRHAPEFFLSSFDTLRGVSFADQRFLLGRRYAFTRIELQFPLEWLVRVALFDLEGVIGADAGGVGNSFAQLWDKRVANWVVGVNFGLGVLVFRWHMARPFGIGAAAVPQNGAWNSNFSLVYRYR
jgi:hypothetical protein